MYTDNYRQAKYYLEKGLACALDEHYAQHIMECYQKLYWVYKMTGNTKKNLNIIRCMWTKGLGSAEAKV